MHAAAFQTNTKMSAQCRLSVYCVFIQQKQLSLKIKAEENTGLLLDIIKRTILVSVMIKFIFIKTNYLGSMKASHTAECLLDSRTAGRLFCCSSAPPAAPPG